MTTNVAGGDRVQEDGEEYDPHLYREVKKPTNNFETLIHMIKGCVGTGILAMPEAFKFSGMVNGMVSTVLIGALCTYCLHILVRSQYVLCKKLKVPLLTYPESMKVACEVGPKCFNPFGPYAPGVTDFFLVFYQLGTCCIYVVFVAVNLKAVIDEYTKPNELSLTLLILCLFVPFMLIICVRNLKLLAPFSVVANIITLITFIVVAYYVCQDLPSFTDLPAFGNVLEYPLYVGTSLFALQSIAVIVALENNMKTPKQFRGTFGILNIGMVIVTSIYVVIAMLGYWKYGNDIESTITLNFPPGEILAQVIRVMYSVAIFISYGLQGYIAVYILWTNYIEKHATCKPLFWEYMLRLACVLLTFTLAIVVPLLGLIISLVGVFCVSALGIAFPAIMELCAYWPDELGPGKVVMIKDIIIILIGIFGLCAGTYSCISAIVQELVAGNV